MWRQPPGVEVFDGSDLLAVRITSRDGDSTGDVVAERTGDSHPGANATPARWPYEFQTPNNGNPGYLTLVAHAQLRKRNARPFRFIAFVALRVSARFEIERLVCPVLVRFKHVS